MKALVLAPFLPQALEALGRRLPVVYEPWTETRRLHAPEELARRVGDEGVSVLVVEADFVFGEVLEVPSLRMVAVCRADTRLVDLEEATRQGVLVVHTPGRTAQAVAELTLGLMLSLARCIPQALEWVRSGRWEDPVEPYISLRGLELAGRTLGVVGMGAIGRRVARLARGVGMSVVAHDPFARIPRWAVPLPLEPLLQVSDFVTLHAPTEAGRLITAERLALMKPSAFLVNTASPALVDQEALAEALKEGRLAGAALDVTEPQPLPPGSALLSAPNLIITPHIGGATDGTVARHSWAVVEEVLRFLEGERPRRLANPRAWRRYGR